MSTITPVNERAEMTTVDQAEMAVISAELRKATEAYITWVVTEMGERSPEELRRLVMTRHPHLATTPSPSISWANVSAEWRHDAQAGQALWKRIKTDARTQLQSGKTAGDAIAGTFPGPWDFAQFLALREALCDGLQPRNSYELLLIDTMAQAQSMAGFWIARHMQLASIEAHAEDRSREEYGGWLPPRVSDAAAIEQAAVMADRFQRMFLKTLKALHDGRKLLTSMTVRGGQVNMADQQIVMPGSDALRSDAVRHDDQERRVQE